MLIEIRKITKTLAPSKQLTESVGFLSLLREDDYTAYDCSWSKPGLGEILGGPVSLPPDEKRLIGDAVKTGLKGGKRGGQVGGFLWEVTATQPGK
jgi:hypothetical protein